ncbi:MAG: ABC transporter substrate-binding protein, partial [Ignavibacteriales bacterium]|nr:ABC transporter substrate-binding protein [Ignavibacteriales bacterium]
MAKKILIVAAALLGSIVAQERLDDDEIRELYRASTEAFERAEWQTALDGFHLIEAQRDERILKDAATVMAAKTQLRMGLLWDAEFALETFLEKKPNHPLADEAATTLANAYAKGEKYELALDMLFLAAASEDSATATRAKSLAERLIFERFDPTGPDDEIFRGRAESLAPFIFLVVGKAHLANGRVDEAKRTFRYVVERFPETPESGEAAKLEALDYSEVDRASETAPDAPVVLALVPLNSSAAHEALAGVKFAFDLHNRRNPRSTALVVENTLRDSSIIVEIANRWKNDPSVVAIVGPLFSDETAWAARAFADAGAPMITPTATDASLARSYPNLFQANPSFEVRGKALAQYAYLKMETTRAVAFAADEGYSAELSRAFVDEFARLGGTICAEGVYPEDSMNVSPHAAELSGALDTTQAVFAPISDVRKTSPILSALSLRWFGKRPGQTLLANTDWMDGKGFEIAPAIMDSVVLVSDYFIDEDDPEVRDLKRRFRETTGVTMGRAAFYGYDATQCLLEAIGARGASRASVRRGLTSGVRFRGVHNDLDFNPERVNQCVNIVVYREGLF